MKHTKRLDFNEMERLQKINKVLNKKLDETNLQAIELLGENTYLKELLGKAQSRIIELENKLLKLNKSIY